MFPPPATPGQRLICEAGLTHVLGVRRVVSTLAKPHRLERIAVGDGELAVERRGADVEGNKTSSTCCIGEDISRTRVRRSRKKAKSLGDGVGVTIARERQEAIARLVVAARGSSRRAAQRVGGVNSEGSPTDATTGRCG